MPRRKEITSNLNEDLFSMQVYPINYDFINFDFNAEFTKWAAIEVDSLENIPEGMESYIFEGGLYAVFHYKGLNTNTEIFNYIYSVWQPHSDYVLDDRPHFELLGKNYKNGDPNSEEHIFIPIRLNN